MCAAGESVTRLCSTRACIQRSRRSRSQDGPTTSAPTASARRRSSRSAVTSVTFRSGARPAMSTSMSSPLPAACWTVTPSAMPGSTPARAAPSRTTITGWAIRSEAAAARTRPTNVRAAPARSRHHPVGRDPTTLAASIRSTAQVWSMTSPGRRTRVANCAQHGWVPRHLGGRMRGDAQPGARQWRGVQPGHRLQGDGVSPTGQGVPGFVDGDSKDRPPTTRLGVDLPGGNGLEKWCDGPGTSKLPNGVAGSLAAARREDRVPGHTLLSPCTGAALTEGRQYFSLRCGENGDYCVCCDCAPVISAGGHVPFR